MVSISHEISWAFHRRLKTTPFRFQWTGPLQICRKRHDGRLFTTVRVTLFQIEILILRVYVFMHAFSLFSILFFNSRYIKHLVLRYLNLKHGHIKGGMVRLYTLCVPPPATITAHICILGSSPPPRIYVLFDQITSFSWFSVTPLKGFWLCFPFFFDFIL